jgi:hypothetical protein
LDAQSGSPQDHDQTAQSPPVRVVASGAHDGDDLLHLRRIGRVARPLLLGAWPAWNPRIVAGDRRRPARSSSSSDITPPRSRGGNEPDYRRELSAARGSRTRATPSRTEQRRNPIRRDYPVCLKAAAGVTGGAGPRWRPSSSDGITSGDRAVEHLYVEVAAPAPQDRRPALARDTAILRGPGRGSQPNVTRPRNQMGARSGPRGWAGRLRRRLPGRW